MRKEQIKHLLVSKNMKKIIIISLFVSFFLTGIAYSQFGKNKVQYDNYHWSYIQSDNFDIYFYEGGEDLALFAEPVVEQALKDISSILNWRVRKRISLILYNSHSDFQQTNVILDYMYEGIGGVTELFKNRAVVPFDGSYADFWHTLRHELLHVVVNDMIYGGNVQSMISGRVRLQIPLWMHEGLAEYTSLGWDTHADLTLRDAALGNEIPNLDELDYYMTYKGGQSVYRYIASRYGNEKIGEIWAQMKGHGNAEKGMKAAIGMDMKELGEKWHRWVRAEYWPDVADRDEIKTMSKQLTDHRKIKNYFNTGPAISPSGDKVAIMSDRKGYADIFLISSLDGKPITKLVSGQKSPDLEELKWLNPRLSWSPDSKKIVLAVKSGKDDALIIVDVKTKKRERITFTNLDEIFDAAWSPDGESIALVGLKSDRSDLYLYNLKTKTTRRLTNDRESDFEPSWSPDSKKIVFASQRNGYGNDGKVSKENLASGIEFRQTDLYVYDMTDSSITRLTDSPWDENYPVWANTKNAIIYTSDMEGISNIYVYSLDTKESVAITSVLTGIFQPSLSKDDSRLAFAGFADGGWDIYMVSNPLSMMNEKKEIKPTVYAKEIMKSWNEPAKAVLKNDSSEVVKPTLTRTVSVAQNYSNYIFAPSIDAVGMIPDEPDTTPVKTDTLQNKTPDGKFVVNPYKTKFTLDMIDSQAGYNTFWGLQGTTIFAFSDILGNHQLLFGTEMYIDLENSDYYLAYQYLGKRTNYSVVGFHSANFWSLSYYYMLRLRNYGADFSVSRPFSRLSRSEFGLTSYNVEQSLINILTGTTDTSITINTLLPRVGLVFDNTLWGYFYPMDGWRGRLDFMMSPKYNKNSMEFQSLTFDLRRYYKLDNEYSFGLRLSGGLSEGKNAQRFFLGGESNWINQKYRRYHDYENVEDLYFSQFVTPLRGARYYEREGTRYFLANLEFRYPFIKYMALGWPLPMRMGGIQGITFLDFGSAWDGTDFHPFGRDLANGLYMDDLVSGVGCGMRLFFGYFLLKIDVAWRYDFDQFSKPKYYLSLGLDF